MSRYFWKQLRRIFAQSALDKAFADPIQVTSTPPAASSEIKDQYVFAAELVDGSTTSPSTTDLEDSWKAEYEAQVQSWRAQSAEAREKAEKERLKWESIRAIEKEEAVKRKAAGIIDKPPEFIANPVGESSNIASASIPSNAVLAESGLVSFFLRFSAVK